MAEPTLPPAGAANEPVAWRVRNGPSRWLYLDDQRDADEYRKAAVPIENLYLAPPPSQVEQAPVDGIPRWAADKIEAQTRALSDVTAERDMLREAVKVKDAALRPFADRTRWSGGHVGYSTWAMSPERIDDVVHATDALNFIPPQGAGGRDAAGTASPATTADPKPRFKVGDWAKVVAVPAARAYGWAGRRVQVLSIGGPDTLDYRVTDLPADGKEPTRWIWLREADLEPAEAEPTLTRADVRREWLALMREYDPIYDEEIKRAGYQSIGFEARARTLSRMEAGK